MKPSACCCRSFGFPHAPTREDLLRWTRWCEDDLASLLSAGVAPDSRALRAAWDNALMLSLVEPLPTDFALWPEDSRAAYLATGAEGRDIAEASRFQFYRCRALGPDGLCTIYASRPYICRDFQPRAGCSGCASFDPATTSCRPAGTAASSVPPLEPARVLEAAAPDA